VVPAWDLPVPVSNRLYRGAQTPNFSLASASLSSPSTGRNLAAQLLPLSPVSVTHSTADRERRGGCSPGPSTPDINSKHRAQWGKPPGQATVLASMTQAQQARRSAPAAKKRRRKKPPALAYLGWILFGLSKLPDAARARRNRLQNVAGSM
jgi:hypothetical protein